MLNMDNKDAQNLINEEKIKLINEACDDFIKEVEAAKKEHRKKINDIVKRAEERKIKEIQEELKSL